MNVVRTKSQIFGPASMRVSNCPHMPAVKARPLQRQYEPVVRSLTQNTHSRTGQQAASLNVRDAVISCARTNRDACGAGRNVKNSISALASLYVTSSGSNLLLLKYLTGERGRSSLAQKDLCVSYMRWMWIVLMLYMRKNVSGTQ